MLNITSSVQEIIQRDEIAIEALRSKILNFSAYAKSIHEQVEANTRKPVRVGTIVVTLIRLSKTIENLPKLRPMVKLTDLSVKTDLIVLTYKKGGKTGEKIGKINFVGSNDFFTITEGLKEITIIASKKLEDKLIHTFGKAYTVERKNLVAVTLHFPKEYINTPNIIYTLLGSLASQRTNIIEIVSTYTELTFVIDKAYIDQTISALHEFL